MINTIRFQLAIKIGIFSALVGLIVFTLNWQLFDYLQSSIPGYSILLFPGNLTLDLLWHPLFSEEINFYTKLALLMGGQFTVTGVIGYGLLSLHQAARRNHRR